MMQKLHRRVALAIAILFANPAFAQVTERGREVFIMYDMRGQAEKEFALGHPDIARDTCRELLGFIDSQVRTIPKPQLAESRDWAAKCADGTYSPYRRKVDPLDVTGNYLDYRFNIVWKKITELSRLTPYDGKSDPQRVSSKAAALTGECWEMTDDAKRFGQGAMGLVKACQGAAWAVESQTIKPQKKVLYCDLMRDALAEFARIDISWSRWKGEIQLWKMNAEQLLADPRCARKK